MSTTATVTSVTSSNVTVSWTTVTGATTYDIVVYRSSSQPVTTSSTNVGTYSNRTSPATLTITTVGGNYYAATVTANFNSAISATVGPIVSPTAVSASLITWFDGASGLTSSSWTNRGTNGGSATLYSAYTTTINGLSAARFPNAATGTSYGSFNQQFANQARAYFIVMKLNTSSTGFQVMMSQTNAGGYNWNMNGFSTSCAKLLNNNNNGANIANPINQVYESAQGDNDQTNLNIYNVINSATATSNNYSFTNNTSRALQTSVTASGYKTSSVLTYIAAAPPGGMYSADCTICEVLAYNGEMTAYEASNVRYYLGLKWGITIFQPPPIVHQFTGIITLPGYTTGTIIENTSSANVTAGTVYPGGGGVSVFLSGNTTVTITPGTLVISLYSDFFYYGYYVAYVYYYNFPNLNDLNSGAFIASGNGTGNPASVNVSIPVGIQSYYIELNFGPDSAESYWSFTIYVGIS